MYFIEGRFWSKVAVNFGSLFYWPTTHQAFVRGRTPLQGRTVLQTGRDRQHEHRCLHSSSTSNERTEYWEGTLSMTHRRTIRHVQHAGEPSVTALCVREQGLSACCKLWWTSRSWRSRTHADRRLNAESDTTPPWLRLSCAAPGKIGLVLVHLCDSSHRASPTSPRLKRGMTFGLGQRSGNSSALNRCVHCGFHAAGWCFAVDPRSMGKLRFAFSVAWGRRRCSAWNTTEWGSPCSQRVLRARKTPVPLIL